jgi:hypothetical protein
MSGSRRVGLSELSRLLGPRDRAVLAGVAEHRFLTTRQIEGFYFTGHATPSTSSRICRRVLHRLYSLHIIEQLQRRVGGIRAGSSSYTWCVGPAGDRWLRAQSGEGVRRRFEEPSTTFLGHTLAVAETHLRLVQADRAGALELIEVELEPATWRRYTGSSGTGEILRPDLYVVIGDGDTEYCTFLEVDRDTESVPVVLRACRRYEAYRATGLEQAASGTFPRVLWLVPSDQRAAKLAAAIAEARMLDQQLFAVSTFDELLRGLTSSTTVSSPERPEGGDHA